MMAGCQSEQKDPLIGKLIAQRYEILAVLGKGGMSVVYLARHLLMNKVVAIKVLHRHLTTDTVSLQRFRQEARAASSLNHPNVITVHDFGVTTDDGQPFLVMDYVSGVSLGDLLARGGPLPVVRVLHILAQACDALAHAHAHGVIHRDLKPSNIMLVENERQEDCVKIVDFGIAKLLPQEGQEYKQLTQTGETFGSPLYMSPEQCLAGKLDARSDIYAMGCVMYELLTGTPPFAGGNIYETIYKQINDMPKGLGELACDRKIAEPLEAIVFRTLAKEPDQRYQSMLKLKEDLELAAAGQEKGFLERAYALWQLSRLRQGSAAGRRVLPIKAVICLTVPLLSLITIVSWWLYATYEPVIKHVQDSKEIVWQLYQEEQIQGKVAPEDWGREEDEARAALELSLRGARGDSERQVDALIALASFYRVNDHYADAVIYYLRALDLSQRTNRGLWKMQPLLASYYLADCYYHLRQFSKAELYYKQSLLHCANLVTNHSEKLALIYAKIADCCFFQDKLLEAQEKYSKALEEWCGGVKGNPDEDDPANLRVVAAKSYALTLAKLGDVYRRLAEDKSAQSSRRNSGELMDRAEGCYKRAMHRFEKLAEPHNRDSAMCLNYLGLIHFYQGKIQQSESDFTTSEKDLERCVGKDDLDVARALEAHSFVLWKEKRILEAIAGCSDAIRIRAAQRKRQAEI